MSESELNPTRPLKTGQKLVIGFTEYIDLPDWDIVGVRAKADTGARSSALHVEDITPMADGFVQFHVITGPRRKRRRVEVSAPVTKWARVRSSTGHYAVRCFVRTVIRLGPVEKEIELSLVSRERMIHRMLLGRTALERDFIVDPSRRCLVGKKPKRKRTKGMEP